jgi:hypothetical protein
VVVAAIVTAIGGVVLTLYTRRQERKANAPGSFRADMALRLERSDNERDRFKSRAEAAESTNAALQAGKFFDRLYIQMLLNHIWQGNPPPPPDPPAGFVP